MDFSFLSVIISPFQLYKLSIPWKIFKLQFYKKKSHKTNHISALRPIIVGVTRFELATSTVNEQRIYGLCKGYLRIPTKSQPMTNINKRPKRSERKTCISVCSKSLLNSIDQLKNTSHRCSLWLISAIVPSKIMYLILTNWKLSSFIY